MAAPLNTCTATEQRGVVRFLWAKIWQQRISTKKCCPSTMNIACHVKQSSKTTSFGGNAFLTMTRWKEQCARRSDSNHKNFTPQVSRDLRNGGQVFKFVWRLHWKINAVCMSLSSFVSFQSRFVTYLLTYPHTIDSPDDKHKVARNM